MIRNRKAVSVVVVLIDEDGNEFAAEEKINTLVSIGTEMAISEALLRAKEKLRRGEGV